MDDKELMAKVEEMRKKQYIHDKFQKHTPIRDAAGETVDISWRTCLCAGCGMPVDRSHDGLGRVTSNSLEGYLEDTSRFADKATYIAAVQAYLEMHPNEDQVKNGIRFDGLKVDAQLKSTIHLLDQAEIENRLFLNPDPVTKQIALYVAHISKDVNGHVLDTLRKVMSASKEQGRRRRWSYDYKPDYIAALAHVTKTTLPSDLRKYVMDKSHDLKIRQYLAALDGKPRLSVIKASEEPDACLSYDYMKQYFPEEFRNPEYVAKKLLLEKWDNLCLRYYVDTGLAIDKVTQSVDLLAISKLMKVIPPEDKMKLDALMVHVKDRSEDDYNFLYGDREAKRLAASTVDNNAVLIDNCDSIQQYIDARKAKRYNDTGTPEETMVGLLKLEEAKENA